MRFYLANQIATWLMDTIPEFFSLISKPKGIFMFKKSLFISLLFCQAVLFAQNSKNNGWTITAQSREPYFAPTMANGMIGIQPSVSPLQFQSAILNGLYDQFNADKISGLIKAINFGNIDISLKDNSSLAGAGKQDIEDWQQTIDMKNAELLTKFTFRKRVSIENRLISLRQLPFNTFIETTVTALEDEVLTFTNKTDVGSMLHITDRLFENLHNREQIPLLTTIAETPTGKYKVVSVNTYLFEKIKPAITSNSNFYGNQASFTVHLNKGEIFKFNIINTLCSTAQFDNAINEARRFALYAYMEGPDRLIERHRQAWAELWKGDIIIDGDSARQIDVRFALFNLYSSVREETSYSIPPMALSGTFYYGHIFWDAETWMFPPLLMLQPKLAKSMLEYRFQRLEKAKQNAANHGYKGAMFPWESAETGEEDTPLWALTGPFEHHITADVGIAFWNYYLVTRDKEWLREKGYPVLKAVADFWVSRCELNSKGEYEIKNVVCADEYAENVNNNAFTNGAAICVLKAASKASVILGIQPDGQWLNVAANIPIRRFDNRVIKEYDGYNGQIIKQADADLLSFPLKLITDKQTMKNTLDYYSARVDNGPAMTHSIYSVIANRLNDCEDAYRYFLKGYVPNQRVPFGALSETAVSNDTFFATGAGGMLQAVISGFGGLEITEQGIIQVPSCLPSNWKSLKITGVGPDRKNFTKQ